MPITRPTSTVSTLRLRGAIGAGDPLVLVSGIGMQLAGWPPRLPTDLLVMRAASGVIVLVGQPRDRRPFVEQALCSTACVALCRRPAGAGTPSWFFLVTGRCTRLLDMAGDRRGCPRRAGHRAWPTSPLRRAVAGRHGRAGDGHRARRSDEEPHVLDVLPPAAASSTCWRPAGDLAAPPPAAAHHRGPRTSAGGRVLPRRWEHGLRAPTVEVAPSPSGWAGLFDCCCYHPPRLRAAALAATLATGDLAAAASGGVRVPTLVLKGTWTVDPIDPRGARLSRHRRRGRSRARSCASSRAGGTIWRRGCGRCSAGCA